MRNKAILIGAKDCYKANVVYGCISNFQFDYLKDTFEKLQTRASRHLELSFWMKLTTWS